MLIRISVENFKSFDQPGELAMVASGKIRVKPEHRIMSGETPLLKHAGVWGANAAGKSNLASVFAFIQKTLADGLSPASAGDFCRSRKENESRTSVFEVQFSAGGSVYAYGFAAILSQQRITSEWLHRLLPQGGSHCLFDRDDGDLPVIGDGVPLSDAEKCRFDVYAEDFAGERSGLFLAEMNRGKRLDPDSQLFFFREVYGWIMNNIIVMWPDGGRAGTGSYYDGVSLEEVCRLIRSFDTGISDLKIRKISTEEMRRTIPAHEMKEIFDRLLTRSKDANLPELQTTWRSENGFFNIRFHAGDPCPEITVLVLRQGESPFDFAFGELSAGTRKLFDLADLLLAQRPDTVFVVDELERSLHPHLIERFLRLFREAQSGTGRQLIFTTHEAAILAQDLLRRDEIWFVERGADLASTIYSLDRFTERYDGKLAAAYLAGRYGAVPVFGEYSFGKGG